MCVWSPFLAASAEARATVRDILRSQGLDAKAGPISRLMSVADVVEAFGGAAPVPQ